MARLLNLVFRALGLAALLGSPGHAVAEDKPRMAAQGPFEIEMLRRKISAGGFPNHTANPFKKTTVASFRLKYHGKVVEVEEDGLVLDQFWEACFLEGSATPTVLLATTGVWVVHEAEGKARIQRLVVPKDMTVLQWLDSNSGQPGPQFSIGIRNPGDPPSLRGEGTLLIGGGQTVFDLKTLESFHLQLNMYDLVLKLGGYNAGANLGCDPALGLSPGRSQYFTIASRSAENSLLYEYAIVAVDFRRGKAYSVPFNRNATRFYATDWVTPEWLDYHFQWTREKNGEERLVPRKNAKPYPWIGRLTSQPDYDLSPVKAELRQVLGRFIEKEFGAEALQPELEANRSDYRLNGVTLRLWYRPEEQELLCFLYPSPMDRSDYEIIEKIGKAFNVELARGKHQECFTTFPE